MASSSTTLAKHAAMFASERPAPVAHLALLGLSLLPLIVNVPTNLNVVLTASLAVYAGAWRSIKADGGPKETMTKGDALRFPIVGSCVLFGLFLLFKFIDARLVNALLSFYLGSIAIVVLTLLITPFVKGAFPEDLREKQIVAPPFKIPYVLDAIKDEERLKATVPEICVGFLSLGFCAWCDAWHMRMVRRMAS